MIIYNGEGESKTLLAAKFGVLVCKVVFLYCLQDLLTVEIHHEVNLVAKVDSHQHDHQES